MIIAYTLEELAEHYRKTGSAVRRYVSESDSMQQSDRIAELERENTKLHGWVKDMSQKSPRELRLEKDVLRLEREKADLVAKLKMIRKIFRSENLTQNETAIALQKLSSVIDMMPEQCLSQIKAEAVLGAISACENPMLVVTDCHTDTQKIIDCCEVADLKSYAASIAKGE